MTNPTSLLTTCGFRTAHKVLFLHQQFDIQSTLDKQDGLGLKETIPLRADSRLSRSIF